MATATDTAEETYGWGYAAPGHLPGEPAVPMPDRPPGLEVPANTPFRLPSGVVAFRETREHHDRMQALDQQSRAARIARDQAARDAQMLDQMMRVARSTKDVELALQQQDVIGFRNAVATGAPPLQALQRFPRAATAPLVAGIRATQTPAMAPAPNVVTLPGMPPGVQSGRYGERFSFPPAPRVADQPPTARTGQPVRDVDGNVIGTDVGGGRIIAAPKPAKVEEGNLTDVDRARLSALGREETATRNAIANLKPSNPKYVAGTNQLAVLKAEREGILAGGKQTPTSVPRGTGPTGPINALPKAKADLVTGQLYDVKGAVYRWDGQNFKLVPTR